MVYPTLPQNALNEVFINFHVNPESCQNEEWDLSFEYKKFNPDFGEGNSSWKSGVPLKGEYELPQTEYTKRGVYTVHLKNLEGASTYLFKINEQNWANYTPEIYSYNTFNPQNFEIIAGGDVGNREKSIEMNQNTIMKLKSDLIMIGGDIAYDNNMPNCFYVWDHLLKNIPYNHYDPVTNSTRVAAFIMGVGNHDMGVHSFSNGGINHDAHQPVYKHWFPQEINNGTIPKVKERKTYFSNSFGDKLLIISLDTQYEYDMGGEQTKWLENILKNSNHEIKIIQYHGPVYSSWVQEDDFDNLVEGNLNKTLTLLY